MGMAAQAAEALEECGELPDDGATAVLRIRVLAANLETTAARELLRLSAGRFRGEHALFAQAALDCASWLEDHAPQHREAVRLWHEEVRGVAS